MLWNWKMTPQIWNREILIGSAYNEVDFWQFLNTNNTLWKRPWYIFCIILRVCQLFIFFENSGILLEFELQIANYRDNGLFYHFFLLHAVADHHMVLFTLYSIHILRDLYQKIANISKSYARDRNLALEQFFLIFIGEQI